MHVLTAKELEIGDMFDAIMPMENFTRTFIVRGKNDEGMVSASTWLGKDIKNDNINITRNAYFGKDCIVWKS